MDPLHALARHHLPASLATLRALGDGWFWTGLSGGALLHGALFWACLGAGVRTPRSRSWVGWLCPRAGRGSVCPCPLSGGKLARVQGMAGARHEGVAHLWDTPRHIAPPRRAPPSGPGKILTTAASLLMTTGSLPFLASFLTNGHLLTTMPLLDDPWAVLLCGYFISYLLLDLLLGWRYYRELISPITGWLHHTLYMGFLLIVIQWHVQGAFLLAAIMELPTILLALGHLVPRWRCDWLFGATFFLTRILFHLWLTTRIAASWPRQPAYWLLSLSVFPLHVYWLSRWAVGMWRRARGRRRRLQRDLGGHGRRRTASVRSAASTAMAAGLVTREEVERLLPPSPRMPSASSPSTFGREGEAESSLEPRDWEDEDRLVDLLAARGHGVDPAVLAAAAAEDAREAEADDDVFFDLPPQLLV